MPSHVVVALLPRMDATSVSVTVQALETANRVAASLGQARPFRVSLGSVAGVPVRCGPGPFELQTTRLVRLRPDLVVVPGIGAATEAALHDVLASRDAEDLCGWLRRQARRTVAASCTGVFLLAEAGLLDGVAATTTWWLAGALATLHPGVRVERDAMVIEEGDRITAGASLAQLDLMLRLIAREASPALAGLVARYLVVDERPSQARYIVPSHLARSSTEVAAAERWVREHLARPFGIPELARSVGTSPRTLARRIAEATGSGPLAFVRRIRVDAARHLLATTRLSVDTVAARVGYDDPASLRRAFARFGERPTDARRARGTPRSAVARASRGSVQRKNASRRRT